MKGPLDGRVLLIVEDEVLIAMDLKMTFEDQGAQTVTAHSVAAALLAVEEPTISAAIVDHALGDGDSSEICRRLTERNVPFITYSGNPHLAGPCAGAEHIDKPAYPAVILAAVTSLFGNQQIAG